MHNPLPSSDTSTSHIRSSKELPLWLFPQVLQQLEGCHHKRHERSTIRTLLLLWWEVYDNPSLKNPKILQLKHMSEEDDEEDLGFDEKKGAKILGP